VGPRGFRYEYRKHLHERRHLARAFRGPDAARAAWMLAAAIAAFPLNAHMALYASYWSTVLWWLLIVALAWGRAEGAAARR